MSSRPRIRTHRPKRDPVLAIVLLGVGGALAPLTAGISLLGAVLALVFCWWPDGVQSGVMTTGRAAGMLILLVWSFAGPAVAIQMLSMRDLFGTVFGLGVGGAAVVFGWRSFRALRDEVEGQERTEALVTLAGLTLGTVYAVTMAALGRPIW